MSILLFYFCFLVHHNVIAIYNYTPTDQIFLNCGSSGGPGPDGRQWTEDLSSPEIRLLESSVNKSVNASAPFQGSVDTIPYMTARLSRSQFMYSFSVSPGKKFIRLHFYPTAYQGFSNSRDYFDVKVGRHIILRNFSASIFAAAWDTQFFFKEFCISVARNQKLNVTFYPFTIDFNDTYAFINGIEIVSMPETLYYSSNDSVGLPSIGLNPEQEFNIGNDTVMEMICRLDVGGNTISPIYDTGMYRQWDVDWGSFYIYGVMPRAPNITLNYSRIPRYTAPDDLYKSARSMGLDYSENENNNLTWVVPVDPGFNHLVRLHFCEFFAKVKKINDRRFIIYIDNQTAEAGFDVFEASGGSNIPIYKDYVVQAGKKGQTDEYLLFITLHPHPSSVYADAILNGMEVFKLSDPDGTLAAGINPDAYPSQTPAPAPIQSPPPAINKSNNKKTLFLIIGASIFGLFLILSLLCLVVICSRRKRKNEDYDYESSICSWLLNSGNRKSSKHGKGSSSRPTERCRKFSLAEIKATTNNFHQDFIIGRGGFGNVYRGEIHEKSTSTTVAIKRFNPESRSRQGAKEFKTEIEMLSQLRHNHLVSLIGYCNDKGEMILVYDYMSNGTLNVHLYETNNDPIPWKQRLEICIGAASGLNYLHEGAVHKIVHRDVKTTNILLDENRVAKVSDFGLSKMLLEDKAVTTKVKGTWGYLDPEYFRGLALTEKSDVYSFGVVLLEVLCARRAVNYRLDEDQRNLANWVQKCIKEETIHEIIDPYLMGRISPECFNTFVDVAERCIRNQGTHRPTMREVVDMLEFALQLQVEADSDQKKGKDLDGGVSDCVYPAAPFRAPPVYIAEDVGGDGSDATDGLESDTCSSSGFASSMNFPSQGSGIINSASVFSATTSSSTQ